MATLVRDIVVAHPESVPVLEEVGIDYCCSGEASLAEACAQVNLTVDELMRRIAKSTHEDFQHRFAAVAEGETLPAGSPNWEKRALAELADYIVEQHHSYTRQACGRIAPLLNKVLAAHGGKYPALYRVEHAFTKMARELGRHMAEEETRLFPAIARSEAQAAGRSAAAPAAYAGEVELEGLTDDHQEVGALLDEIRGETVGYNPPAEACESFRRLYQELKDLAHDLHWHVHLENNILFPRALALLRHSDQGGNQ